MVNAGEPLSTVLEHAFPWCIDDADGIRAIFAEYTRRKRAQNVLDYDDLLLFWRALGETPARRDVAGSSSTSWSTNTRTPTRSRRRSSSRCAPRDGQQCDGRRRRRAVDLRLSRCVGPQHPGFPEAVPWRAPHHPRTELPLDPPDPRRLECGHRARPRAVSQGSVARPLRWRAAGAADLLRRVRAEHQVCEQILEHREQGIPLRQQAVLFRTGHHSDLLELELTRRNIPFVKYGGLKFLESAHIKDVLAILRVLENPRDEVSWFRVLQLLDGIGPAGARAIMHAIGVSSCRAAIRCRRLIESPPAGARGRRTARTASACARRLPIASGDWRSAAARRPRSPASASSANRSSSSATAVRRLACRTSNNWSRWPARIPRRGRFLSELALDPPTSTSDLAGPPLLDEDYLILSTVHSAKGGEWDVVHVIHAADGMIPSDMSTGDQEAIEEERRLFYVALTRARDNLYVYFALRFYRRPRGLDDAHHFAQLTRFLPGRGPVAVRAPLGRQCRRTRSFAVARRRSDRRRGRRFAAQPPVGRLNA